MGKQIALVIGLVLAAIIVVRIQNNPPKGWSSFRDDQIGFELEYPSNWYVQHYQPGSQFVVTNLKRGARITDGGGLFSSNGTIFMVDIVPAKTITSVRQLGGASAKWETLQLGTFNGEVLHTSVSWQMGMEFLHKGKLHRLTCMSESPQQQQEVLGACERMIRSIRML